MVGERGRMRRSSVLVGGTLLGLLLAGCTGEREQPSPLPSAGLVTSPTSSPSESPAPQLPEAAKANTPAGAEAFARYALSLYGYTFQTGDTGPIKAISGEQCDFCKNIQKDAQKLRQGRLSRIGGDLRVKQVIVVPNAPKGSAALDITFDETAAKDLDESGKAVSEYDALKDGSMTMFLTRTLTSWSIFDVGNQG